MTAGDSGTGEYRERVKELQRVEKHMRHGVGEGADRRRLCR